MCQYPCLHYPKHIFLHRILFSFVPCMALPHVYTLSHRPHDFRKRQLLHTKFLFDFSTNLTWSLLVRRTVKVKVKWAHYRPGVAQRVGSDIALLFHDRGTRRGWVVGSTPRPHFTLGKDPVPIVQEAEWAPGPVWTGGKSRPHPDSIPDLQPVAQSLYRLSYPDNYENSSERYYHKCT